MSPTAEHYQPDCPVCGASISQIPRNGHNPTVAKRSCRCGRRFQFTITWHADRRCDVTHERVADYARRASYSELVDALQDVVTLSRCSFESRGLLQERLDEINELARTKVKAAGHEPADREDVEV